jgi:hypothetical protein|tara:strand:+ start:29 stop:367 length:339 start_codon:yes stop_codon:yes gene_type:complete
MKNRELLKSATKDIINICNNIYTQIDRGTKDTDDITECDWELVGLFNKLVAINQKNLDALYPDRGKEEPKYLKLKFADGFDPDSFVDAVLPDDFNESYDVWIEDASKSEVES